MPISAKGKPTLRLDTLAPANGFAHESAQDALADVEATIHMARLIRDRVTDEAFRRDRVLVILTSARSQSVVEDLRFLQKTAVEANRGVPSEGSSFAANLRMAGFGSVTRGAVALDDNSGPAPVILQFDVDTIREG